MSSQESLWSDSERAKETLQTISILKEEIAEFSLLQGIADDIDASLELLVEGADEELLSEALQSLSDLESGVERLEFRCKMRGEFDREYALVEINGGSGGTEAQDWAEMLMRMYIRWAEQKGFTVEILDYQPGEVAGIKSSTLYIKGDFAYGYLRSEQGVHRLVRISPFDSNARRHTSFASVAVSPDIEDAIDIAVDEKDLRIDTYRSSGAGGQHVNKTDSAVRITHIPTGIVVACQNERSQHKNRATAMKILKAKLYERELLAQQEKMSEIKGERMKIDFGSQIRSYVMQPYQLVKDLRTQHETSSIQDVLDGDIDPFIEAYLLDSSKVGAV